MTQQPYYPPQPGQQGPPPGWGQQAPQQGYPQADVTGVPFQPQGQFQGPPSPFNQAAPSGPPANAWSNPDEPEPVGGESPAQHQLQGRLCFFKPTKYEPAALKYKTQTGETEQLITAEVLVLDGEPILGNIDGRNNQLTPFSAGPRHTPAYFSRIYIRGAVMPGQLKNKIGSVVLGRVIAGAPGGQGKPPLIIQDATPEDTVVASHVYPMWEQLKAQASGQIAPPAPVQQAPQGGYQVPPPGYAQAPGQPYPGQPYPPQQAAPQGPPPGWGQQVQQPAPPQSWPQQGYPGPTH